MEELGWAEDMQRVKNVIRFDQGLSEPSRSGLGQLPPAHHSHDTGSARKPPVCTD